jgi:CBS domain-containing protein
MRDLSPRERLRRSSIKQIPSTPLDWTVKKTTAVKDMWDKLTSEPTRWFIPIVKDDGTLEGVINEEAVLRFLLDKQEPPAQPAVPPAEPPATAVAERTVADILTFLEEKKLGRFQQIHVTVAIGTTVGAVNDLMDSKHVFLAIVKPDGKSTHFFTTSEVRKLLLTGE